MPRGHGSGSVADLLAVPAKIKSEGMSDIELTAPHQHPARKTNRKTNYGGCTPAHVGVEGVGETGWVWDA